ncbi:MAG: DUF2922 domain-containing protein [Limosilactobacillus coleohominis]|jgi:hypothetical protein|uniref:DUF2922 domain-containing protein n=1 Tax=Limosilactobacillus coleohominis TaxID=181675 RepID=UPI002A80A161|nr:DUF2922 domain-containing protein [Limosilactobacillus coleohominis]MDY3702576.1 DUF2922 domain-containing protein [Limosilactobacillus coleohominis]MDY5628120.1 DUF2922 domain-containing protein [Limosilactobacillus coleohominis]
MKTLNLSFKGSLGKGHSLKLKYANDQLDEATVRNAMQKIVDSQLFGKDDEQLYLRVASAKYVTTTDEPIFSQQQA